MAHTVKEITDAMLVSASNVVDIDEALAGVMQQVGIDDGGIAGLVFSGDKNHEWWEEASPRDRLDMLYEWRNSEEAARAED